MQKFRHILNFNLVLSQCSAGIYQAFDGQTVFI